MQLAHGVSRDECGILREMAWIDRIISDMNDGITVGALPQGYSNECHPERLSVLIH